MTNMTEFDSPDRKSLQEVLLERHALMDNPLLQQMLEGFPEMVVVVNEERQIVAWNKAMFLALGVKSPDQVVGLRFGEAVNCVHKEVNSGGCGTSKFCAECGAANALRQTRITQERNANECRITVVKDGVEFSHDYFVTSAPLFINEKFYILFSVIDNSALKRREALERVFFHDVLNTAGIVSGISEMLKYESDAEERNELQTILEHSSKQLNEEILFQRSILYAERGDLVLNPEKVPASLLLSSAYELYRRHDLAKGKQIILHSSDEEIVVETDALIMKRCLGNLLKNALEASKPGEKVELRAEREGMSVLFHVISEPLIPINIQLSLFKRSFSTKGGVGRGLGTYSIKLFVEQYLKGEVWFISRAGEGTRFTIRLPLQIL